jgi:uncharacterized protein HemX
MFEAVSSEFLLLSISGVGTVLWYLLRQKDEQQAEQIKLLFKKHDEDAEELRKLQLQIAQQHYVKGELDVKFDKLEGAFRDGFSALGAKFDELGRALMQHIQQEESKR